MTNDQLAGVEQKIERSPEFTQAELKMVREMISTYRGLQFLGRAFKAVVVTLGLIAAAVTAWEALSEKVKAWLGS